MKKKLLGSVCCLLLAGCAGQSALKGGGSGVSPEQRAVERWQLVIDGKYDLAYDYLSPGSRELQSRQAYAAAISARPVHYHAVEHVEKSCNESVTVCTVVSKLTFSVISSLSGVGKMKADSIIEERWINSAGRWFLVPE